MNDITARRILEIDEEEKLTEELNKLNFTLGSLKAA